jgi:hypothetical protein
MDTFTCEACNETVADLANTQPTCHDTLMTLHIVLHPGDLDADDQLENAYRECLTCGTRTKHTYTPTSPHTCR